MPEKRIVRKRYSISDFHLGEGAVLPDGRLNPLEDFKDIVGFKRFLREILAQCPEDAILELDWNGDMLDFNPIRWRGSFRVVPTEAAALDELETCLRGHADFFDAASEFLQDPRTRLIVRIGNHDLPLVWPKLEARLIARLLPEGERHRIRFVSGEEVDGEVVTVHGDRFDPFNANPKAKDLFITGKADRGPLAASLLSAVIGAVVAWGVYTGAKDLTLLRTLVVLAGIVSSFTLLGALFRKVSFWRNGPDHRLLNMPYGTYLDTWLIAKLKPIFPWYGRTVGHGHALAERFSVLQNWRHIGLSLTLGLPHLIYHRFFRDLLDARMKANLFASLRMVLAMTRRPNVERSIWRLMRKYPRTKFVIMGHFHAPTVWMMHRRNRRIVLIDTGTGIEQVRMDTAEGGFFARIAHAWRKHPRTAVARLLVHIVIAAIPFGLGAVGGWKQQLFSMAFAACSLAALFLRQSLTLYEKERFTRFTPAEIITYYDASQRVRLLTFDAKAPEGTDPFTPYAET